MTQSQLDVPVALVLFKRPDLVAQVFAQVRAVRPRRLFVIADGPRTESERAPCDSARAQTEVDWPCEVTRVYADANLGCKARVASGIDRVFEQCDEAIILEDDCLPSLSFFRFCEALLARYRQDERVMCIGGTNLYPGARAHGDGSYYFARYGATWGWATWKRAWKHFDVEMTEWPRVRRSGALRDVFATREERWFWTALFDAQHEGRITGWDYQWLFARLLASGLTAAPWTNLVANLGFRADATHTARVPRVFDPSRRSGELAALVHPDHVIPRRDVDEYYFRRIFNPLGLAGVTATLGRKALTDLLRIVRRDHDRKSTS